MTARLRRFEQSSDLVQSVCREALEDRGFEFRSAPEFRAWLWVTALNKLRDRLRYAGAAKRDAAREDRDSDTGAPHEVAGPDRSPSEAAAAKEEAALLERAFAELPDDQRKVLELSHMQGMSHAAIGERIGRTELAVRSLVYRAMARLSTLLIGANRP